MAKRLDDTEDRPPGRPPAERHSEVEAAEFEGEQPARDLSGLPKLVISVAALAVSLYALLWVVRPQPAQPYRTSFLAVTLAM
ncbi:MAG TPA: C4-dicarboxylate ABC transporter permease, partial [Actinomycetota bacterium]|nr:C4-dicarboxylate ABC transporter permease [Actinomycetota bacterium]